MIDVESEVFTRVATALRSELRGVTVVGESVRTPSAFPCASIVEADNHAHLSSQDSSGGENHADIMYEVNVYSNKKEGKKTECKRMLTVIDSVLSRLGFTRIMTNTITMEEATVYRMVSRYRAVVSQNHTIYRR